MLQRSKYSRFRDNVSRHCDGDYGALSEVPPLAGEAANSSGTNEDASHAERRSGKEASLSVLLPGFSGPRPSNTSAGRSSTSSGPMEQMEKVKKQSSDCGRIVRYMEGSVWAAQVVMMNKLAAGRKTRVAGVHLGGEDWNRNGSFVNKPTCGWLHADDKILGPGVSYPVRYMGCIEVLQSMRTLDFNTRTYVTREAIARVCEAVPGAKGSFRRRKPPTKVLSSVLGSNNLQFAGMTISLTISTNSLVLMTPDSKQDTTDYVAYVAKDPVNQRACHILECGEGRAQDVISTIGQAFELRFKQYLKNPPKLITPHDRMSNLEGSAWDEEEEDAEEHQYYNSIPGKEMPSTASELCFEDQAAAMLLEGGGKPVYTNAEVAQPSRKTVQSPVGQGGVQHTYVNTRLPVVAGEVLGMQASQQPRDAFDMKPFEDALKTQGVVPVPFTASSPATNGIRTSPAPGPPREKELRAESWFHGCLTRREAEGRLCKDGDFLVRESTTTHGQFVLTGMQSQQVKHLLLVDPEGVVRTKDRRFDSVSHLIEYHRDNQLPIISAGSELCLKQPVNRLA
uniref:SHC-transforming protein 1 isoform X2 n=1 Tax=Myxine glutinosa TaxID=7769 RepID=UPI00358E16F3